MTTCRRSRARAACLVWLLAPLAGCASQPKCFECGLNKEWARAEEQQRRQRADEAVIERFSDEDPGVVGALADELAARSAALSTQTLRQMVDRLGVLGAPEAELARQRARALTAAALAVGKDARAVLEQCVARGTHADLCRQTLQRLEHAGSSPR